MVGKHLEDMKSANVDLSTKFQHQSAPTSETGYIMFIFNKFDAFSTFNQSGNGNTIWTEYCCKDVRNSTKNTVHIIYESNLYITNMELENTWRQRPAGQPEVQKLFIELLLELLISFGIISFCL